MSNQSFIDLINEEQQVIYRFHDLEHVRNEVEKLVHEHLQNSSLTEIEEFIKSTSINVKLVTQDNIENFTSKEQLEIAKTIDPELAQSKCRQRLAIFKKAATKIQFDYRRLIDFYSWNCVAVD